MKRISVDADLVKRVSPVLFVVVRRYRIGRDEQLDAVQDGWLRLLESRDRIRDPASVPGWMSTTVARRALRSLRDRSREVLWDPGALDQQPTFGSSAERLCVRAERDRLLWRTVASLPRQERDVVALLAVEPDMTGWRLAQQLGMSASSAARLRARSLRRMRRLLAAQGVLGP